MHKTRSVPSLQFRETLEHLRSPWRPFDSWFKKKVRVNSHCSHIMSADFGWVNLSTLKSSTNQKSEVVCIPSVDKSADMSLTPLLLHTPHDADASPPRPGTCRRRRRRCPTQRPPLRRRHCPARWCRYTWQGNVPGFHRVFKGGLENHPISSKVSP